MKIGTAQRSLAWVLVIGGVVVGSHAGCDGGGGDGAGSAACSSCQEAYTEADCKAWGDLAGCESAVLDTEKACTAGLAGCAFTNCKGAPICNDMGTATCGSCNGDLSQADCDSIGKAAGCSSAVTQMGSACGKAAVGCDFVGCDFHPTCP